MAWLEKRGDKFRIAFRFWGERFRVNLKATEAKEANGCLVRLEENLRLVERGRIAVQTRRPAGRRRRALSDL
jgi:hypothetical protein